MVELFIGLSFLGAGLVKGILGMGMPAVLMVLLTLVMSPLEAIALILVPVLLVNLFQYLRSSGPVKIARDYSLFALFTFVTIILVGFNLRRFPEEFLLATVGGAMILFGASSLFGFRLTIGPSKWWQVVWGIIAGIIGGLSSIWSLPIVMYLVGRNVGKEEFVGIVGFLFMTGSLGLGIALGSIDLLTPDLLVPALLGLGISLIGFRFGESVRARINTDMFRKLILLAFVLMGSRLILLSVL